MFLFTKKQILGFVLTFLFGSGGYLAVTEPVPCEPQQIDAPAIKSPLASTVEASADNAMRYDDGRDVPAGAHVHCPPGRNVRTVGWWQRGPIRRVVAAPFRWLFHRRCRWR